MIYTLVHRLGLFRVAMFLSVKPLLDALFGQVHVSGLGERLPVGSRFHRLPHSIGVGREGAQPGSLVGCNFAVLFPVWDMLFGSTRFDGRFEPTGIRDQLPEYGARAYGTGFWAQQWLGLKRLLG